MLDEVPSYQVYQEQMNSPPSSLSNRNRRLYSKTDHILGYISWILHAKTTRTLLTPHIVVWYWNPDPVTIFFVDSIRLIYCWLIYEWIDPTLSNTNDPNKMSPGLILSSLCTQLSPNITIDYAKANEDRIKTIHAVTYSIWTLLYSKSISLNCLP